MLWCNYYISFRIVLNFVQRLPLATIKLLVAAARLELDSPLLPNIPVQPPPVVLKTGNFSRES